MDLDQLLAVAEHAASRGCEVVRDRTERAATSKGTGDYVTAVDLASERAITALLREATPDIPVLGEEEGGAALGAGQSWVVDPLDGTTNFVHGFPVVGVSVALVEEGRPVAGAVEAPFLGGRWAAARGRGAFGIRDVDASRVRLAGSTRGPAPAVVGAGLPVRHTGALPRDLRVREGALGRVGDRRRAGAASACQPASLARRTCGRQRVAAVGGGGRSRARDRRQRPLCADRH